MWGREEEATLPLCETYTPHSQGDSPYMLLAEQ